ncbi:MAG: hypothetical protein WC401_13215 [Bacteroidales bacterium]|jgi:hypothetical protein
MKEPKAITFDELMKETKRLLANPVDPRRTILTNEQIKFLIQARGGNQKLRYKDVRKLWELAGWGEISETSARRYFAIALEKIK